MRAESGAARQREFSVKALADYLRGKFASDDSLRVARVRGEVSNRSVSARGHLNFVLKEDDAVLQCFAWQDDFLRFPEFGNGAAVIVSGAVTIYPQRSLYQMIARRVELAGIGDIHRLFEERKRRLAAEGLFEVERKRPIPAFPFRVALVSSRRADGAVDFETRLRLRRPHVGIEWCETSVQGASAPHEIVGALAHAGQLDVDVVVVTRGGGSFEDLFAFSDEGVVRAIARCPHPVISAVGHTVNQQLSDFAADLHAETPSAAAERIGPETREIVRQVSEAIRRGRQSVGRSIERQGSRLDRALTRSKLDDPKMFLVPHRQRLEAAEESMLDALAAALERRTQLVSGFATRLGRADPSRKLAEQRLALQAACFKLDVVTRDALTRAQRRLQGSTERLVPSLQGGLERRMAGVRLAQARLDGKNPETILQHGYAIVTHAGKIVRDPAEVPLGDPIEARVARGTLRARVESRTAHGNEVSG